MTPPTLHDGQSVSLARGGEHKQQMACIRLVFSVALKLDEKLGTIFRKTVHIVDDHSQTDLFKRSVEQQVTDDS